MINTSTPIYMIDKNKNNIYIKRDDLIPFSFGGNKARKGMLFWKDIKRKKADHIVTYGSSSSNHCRVIANIAAGENIPITIISPKEIEKETFNLKMMRKFGAEFIFCPVAAVSKTIDSTMKNLQSLGKNPYFIMGGGHGNIGTQAYVDCYNEICEYENKKGIKFDYIFHASGTGTTQAGLVVGQLIAKDKRKIVGISIARKCPYGRNVIVDSVREYLGNEVSESDVQNSIIFEDSYVASGYGDSISDIKKYIEIYMNKYGIPLDETYTGKAIDRKSVV